MNRVESPPIETKSRNYLIVTLAIMVVAAGLAVWMASRPTPVTLVTVETRDVSEVYVVTGRVRSRTTSNVGSELAGRIAAVHVKEGSRPERAQPLVDLQPLDAKLSVQQAEASLEIAKRELERTKRGPTQAQRAQVAADLASATADLEQAQKDLARAKAMATGGVGTAVELERAQSSMARAKARVDLVKAQKAELNEQPRDADIRVAQARLDAATANLDQTKATLGKTTIIAPFDGLVVKVDASVGENVRPAEGLVTLVRTDDLEFYAEVDELYFGQLKKGQKATAVFYSNTDKKFPAVVTQVGPDVDPDRGVVAVHLDPESLPDDVVPGLSADIAIELQTISDARSIPNDALARDRGTYVFVVKDGVARRVEVKVEAEGEEYVAVSGIDDVQSVIRDIALIDDGQKVSELKP